MNITLDLRKTEDRRRQNLGPPLWHLERRSQVDRRIGSHAENQDAGRAWIETLKSGTEAEHVAALDAHRAQFV